MRAAILAVAVLLGGCGPGGSPALARLHPCLLDEGPTDAFCGTLRVFEDRAAEDRSADARFASDRAPGQLAAAEHHAAPQRRTIDLKIVVAPALKRNARPDPLFVFEGGPGGGAATLAPERLPMFRRFQIDRDIVLVDQRGTGASNPLDCPPDPADEDDVRSLETYPVSRYRTCLDRLQADPRHYTTAVAMDDIDDVRASLGYDQINLWGGSYGTRAALVYLRRHERAVRSVVLDGVAPTDMRLPLFMARDSQRALDRLLDDCARDAVCSREYPDLRGIVSRLWARLAERPTVVLPHPRTGQLQRVTMTPRLVAAVVFQALYAPDVAA
ncbi:MAG: alpha/beta fold hydrolase, partial [Vicinamibacterales bacterium]